MKDLHILDGSIFNNHSLICAFVSWFIAQVLKTIFYFISEKRFDIRRFSGSGGMPSGHSAAVVALSFSIGREYGVESPVFAISFVLAAIVMYDANGIRRSSGEQAKLLNKMIEVLDIPEIKQTEIKKRIRMFNKDEPYNENIKLLKEQLGHTPIEVLAGFLIGVIVVLLF